MKHDYEISADGLRTAAGAVEEPGKVAQNAQVNLQARLDARGHPFGEDEIGMAFYKNYKPGKEAVMDTLTNMNEGFVRLKGNFEAMAGSYEKTEKANSE
jgi:hypothetical protein